MALAYYPGSTIDGTGGADSAGLTATFSNMPEAVTYGAQTTASTGISDGQFWPRSAGGASTGGAAETPERETIAKTTASLAAGAYEQSTITMAKGYRLLDLTCSSPARVRIYTDPTKQAADAARAATTYPTGDHGLVMEFIATSGLLTYDFSPALDGFDGKSTPDGLIPITITNTGTGAAAITATFNWIRTE